MFQSIVADGLIRVGYILVFATAAAACVVTIGRARQIQDRETRQGLVALLVTSGLWASAHVAFFVVPGAQFQRAAYISGLVVGLATVGPWLYFCSAYTGRTLHRNVPLRRLAVLVFLAIVAVKVTNPWHGLYFSAEMVSQPFEHLAIQHHTAHWLAMGLSYALAAIGYFMLLERLLQVNIGTRPLALLVGVTGLPLGLDLAGYASPALVDIAYEPLGVAVFAIGVTYVFLERFQAIQIAGRNDKPVLILNDEDRIREYNAPAADLFPSLQEPGVVGEPLWTVLPSIAEALESEPALLGLTREGTNRYYQLSESPFAAGQTPIGRLVLFTDVTDQERDRRELARQNERLDRFASVVSHDLRNPLQILRGSLDAVQETGDREHLERGYQAIDRMETIIGDVLSLARQGQPIDDREPVRLSQYATECWDLVQTGDATLVLETDVSLLADPERLRQLLENLFRNAIEHGGEDVSVRVGPLDDLNGFYVADDGPGIPPADRPSVFESGYSSTESGTGFGLAIVAEIVEAHGWEISVTDDPSGGARFEITGIRSAESTAVPNEAA